MQRLSVTDTSITGGAPGIMAAGTAAADNWSGGSATSSAAYSVGGSVSGLSGTVVLQDNGGDNLSLTANGAFTFATALAGGTAYTVTVKTNPSGETCTVSNGSGTIASANVTNVTVSLRERARLQRRRERVGAVGDGGAARQRWGQPVADRERGVHLRHRAGRRHRLHRDRQNQPLRGNLHRFQRLGHHRLGQHHQRHRRLRERARLYVGGSVSGLSGTVVLQDNGGDNLSLTANGAFTFATALAGGTAYTVTVKTNPSGETCTVSNGSGTIASANVTNVTVVARCPHVGRLG